MLIGVDANEANVNDRVGSNEFAYQILWQLYRQDKKNQYLIYLKTKPLKTLPKSRIGWEYRILTPTIFYTQWRLPLSLYLDQPRPKIFLTLGHYAPRFSPIPTLICIMDLAFLKFPQTFKFLDLWQLKNWTAYSVRRASHIFSISQATKQDIINYYQFKSNQITVVYPGINRLTVTGSKPIKNKYLLYIGTLQPRKNIDALIAAFNSIKSLNYYLLIAGKVGWKYQIKSAPQVKYLGYVAEEKLGVLIKNSSGLILPSLYEGFGIPVLQAMSLGVPVLVSRNSSLPEIVGNCGYYIEPPFDADAIRTGIIKLLSGKINQRLAQIRAQEFSWSKSAAKILEVINDY